jgi:hypothetical protein
MVDMDVLVAEEVAAAPVVVEDVIDAVEAVAALVVEAVIAVEDTDAVLAEAEEVTATEMKKPKQASMIPAIEMDITTTTTGRLRLVITKALGTTSDRMTTRTMLNLPWNTMPDDPKEAKKPVLLVQAVLVPTPMLRLAPALALMPVTTATLDTAVTTMATMTTTEVDREVDTGAVETVATATLAITMLVMTTMAITTMTTMEFLS